MPNHQKMVLLNKKIMCICVLCWHWSLSMLTFVFNWWDINVLWTLVTFRICSTIEIDWLIDCLIVFSSNRITTLADFAHCSNLESLYFRNNSVSDVAELEHLKGLNRLRVLWLEGNPCTKDPAYRTSLLQMLPKLYRLDNTGTATTTITMTIYVTFFPNNEIQKFFPGFHGTLSIQCHELRLINIVLLYTMPWLNINDLIK